MKLPALLAHVAAKNPTNLERTVLEVIAAMGFHVAHNGEICDPRPAPPSTQRNVHWSGGRRGR